MNFARTSILINKRRFSRNTFIDSFGGETRCKQRRESLFVLTVNLMPGSTLPNSLKPEVIEMAAVKPEETLHDYIRRYFEKIAKGMTRQLAEQGQFSRVEVIPNTPSSAESGS